MTTDTAPAGATPVVAGATPAQTSPAADAGSQPATGAADTDAAALGDPGKRALDAMKRERDDAKAAAKAAEDRAKALEQANMTADEKKSARLTELERESTTWATERQGLRLQLDVERHAARLGFADPADALGLIDRAGIEFNADGSPKNTAKLLEDLVKAKPYLVRQGAQGGSFDTGSGGSGNGAAGRTYTRAELQDVEFYAKNKADIERAYREGRIRTT